MSTSLITVTHTIANIATTMAKRKTFDYIAYLKVVESKTIILFNDP